MTTDREIDDSRMFQELQELVALEVKDILATAAEEGFAPRDVVGALELALQAEIAALADPAEAKPGAAPEPVEPELPLQPAAK